MAKVAVEFLRDGMILAADVLDRNGVVLFGKGAAVGERHRGLFAARKIRFVDVLDPRPGTRAGDGPAVESGGAVAPDTAVIQQRFVRLAAMFNGHRNDPLMRELCRLAIRCAQEGLIRA